MVLGEGRVVNQYLFISRLRRGGEKRGGCKDSYEPGKFESQFNACGVKEDNDQSNSTHQRTDKRPV